MRRRDLAAAPPMPADATRRRRAALALLAALSATACRREAPLRSCRDSLAGVWRVLDGDAPVAPPRRWALLDRGARVEGYPLFDDSDATATAPGDDRIRSPRSLALIRSHTSLVGHVERWVMRGAQKCPLRAPARVFGCKAEVVAGAGDDPVDVVSVQLNAPAVPDDLATCVPAPAAPAPAAPPERWYRER